MKNNLIKILLPIILLSTFYFLLSSAALAQPDINLKPNCDPTLALGKPGACDLSAAIAFVKKIINMLFYIAIPLGVIMVVWGGFVIMTSAGNESRVEQGKKVITAAVIGIAIALGAWLIITALNFFIQSQYQFK